MLSIAVLGEKNHGKSTLIGRIIFETKSMPNDRVREVKLALANSKKKFEWAHLLDSFRYEREHEMTLDTTRAIVHFGQTSYEFIDVPGHKKLIKNMLTGASEATCAIVVIDIREGIRPQTLRHLKIARFLGIEKILAVVNKCDLAKNPKLEFTKIREEIAGKLNNIGYDDVQILPIAAFGGDNLRTRSKKMTWYRGPTLFESIKMCLAPSAVETDVGTVITVQGVLGAVITGKVYRGRVREGDTVTVCPGGAKRIVRCLWIGRARVKTAPIHASVSISLSGSKPLRRGNVLFRKYPVTYAKRIEATCIFIGRPSSGTLIDANFNTSQATITGVGKLYDPIPVCIMLKKKIPILREFVVSENSQIIGIGKI